MKLVLLFLSIAVFAVYADTHACKPQNIINRPQSNEFYFPADWNENESPPTHYGGNGCSWYFNIPQGYYAKLIINGNLYSNYSYFQIVDFNGFMEQSRDQSMIPYYFPYPKFLLTVELGSNAAYGFKVEWAPFPTGITSRTAIGSVPRVVNVTNDVNAAEYSAVDGISLLAFPADTSNFYSLRSTMVFEGTDYTGKFVGNLYNLYNIIETPNQYISKGKSLYVVNVEARHVLDKLLIQESGFTKDIGAYSSLDCAPRATCTKRLWPGYPKSGIVYVGNQTQTLTAISMDTTATLSVYYGGITSSNLYKTYSASTIQSQLPLTFDAGITQYIISEGRTSFTFNFSS